MQEGDVGASNSDLQTDQADDDDTHMLERCVRECRLASANRKLSRSCANDMPSCHFILHVVFFSFPGEAQQHLSTAWKTNKNGVSL